jgi:hypothetical protein
MDRAIQIDSDLPFIGTKELEITNDGKIRSKYMQNLVYEFGDPAVLYSKDPKRFGYHISSKIINNNKKKIYTVFSDGDCLLYTDLKDFTTRKFYLIEDYDDLRDEFIIAENLFELIKNILPEDIIDCFLKSINVYRTEYGLSIKLNLKVFTAYVSISYLNTMIYLYLDDDFKNFGIRSKDSIFMTRHGGKIIDYLITSEYDIAYIKSIHEIPEITMFFQYVGTCIEKYFKKFIEHFKDFYIEEIK